MKSVIYRIHLTVAGIIFSIAALAQNDSRSLQAIEKNLNASCASVIWSVQYIMSCNHRPEIKDKNLEGPCDVVLAAFISPFKTLDGFSPGAGPVCLLPEEESEAVNEDGPPKITSMIIAMEQHNGKVVDGLIVQFWSSQVNTGITKPYAGVESINSQSRKMKH